MKTNQKKTEASKMIARCMVAVFALGLLACEADVSSPYGTSWVYGPYTSTMYPALWITYPVEDEASAPGHPACLTPDEFAEFPLHFTTYNAPTGSGVQFILDRYVNGGRRVCGCGAGLAGPCVVGLPTTSCTFTASPVIISMAGIPDGRHQIYGEIVQANGAPLSLPDADPAVTCLHALCDKKPHYHQFQVNFWTETPSASPDANCPLPEEE